MIDDGSDDGIKGDSADIGDIVNYDVTINPIPNYGGDHPVLNVVDTLSAGLDYVEGSLTVKIGETSLTEGTDYTLAVSGQEITVDFVVADEYKLNSYVGQSVVIEYSAEVTSAAAVNEDGNNNDVTLNYTKDSKVDGDDGTDKDKTYTYTFDIDGSATGTKEIITKVGEDGDAEALEGAVFGLYTDEDATMLYTSDIYTEGCTVTSDTEGQLYITGLEAGTYYLKEISAPRESTGADTILAGFPFFEDWGRDTMIAMAGCCISVRRYETAKSILRTFAVYEKDGLMPNLFPRKARRCCRLPVRSQVPGSTACKS